MVKFVPGDKIIFKNNHGIVSNGVVYDSNEIAIMVSTVFGICSIDRSDIISGGNKVESYDSSSYEYENYDNVWWDEEDIV